jgi:hypothetical protein
MNYLTIITPPAELYQTFLMLSPIYLNPIIRYI